MSDIPETVRIGGIDYKVVEVMDLRDGNTGLNGHILYNDCEIRIEANVPKKTKWLIVWHEAVHGILENAGINRHTEQMIVALGYGIAQVLRDNPWLRELDEWQE